MLILNSVKARTKRDYIRVEFKQTASHMHYALDFGIQLPSDFNMAKYENLDRAAQIDYVKQNLPLEPIINYQNEIGRSMNPLFGKKKLSQYLVLLENYKKSNTLTIQLGEKPGTNILSIIREEGVHISSFCINDATLRKLAAHDFWALKKHTIQPYLFMKKYFNLQRYKELLKLEENGEISSLDLELLTYTASVEEKISYDRRKEYFILINQYLSRIISPDEFRSKFLQIKEDDSKKSILIYQDFQQLEVFTITQNIEKFSDLIEEIRSLCFDYDEIWDGTIERMSESEFYHRIKDYYL